MPDNRLGDETKYERGSVLVRRGEVPAVVRQEEADDDGDGS